MASKDPFLEGLESLSSNAAPASGEDAPPKDPFLPTADDGRLPSLLPDLSSGQAGARPSKDPFDSSDSEDEGPGPTAPPKRQFKVPFVMLMRCTERLSLHLTGVAPVLIQRQGQETEKVSALEVHGTA